MAKKEITEGESINLNELLEKSVKEKIEEIAPNFRKSNITQDQIERIIATLSATLKITPERTVIGMMLLFLQGAASTGTPPSMSVEIEEGKIIEKRNIVNACQMVTGHQYIRRIAEALALQIGQFALNNKLKGELANRINTKYKAETGYSLNEVEMAYCSSFSQSISDLETVASERLAKLLSEDYQRRFEYKKKNTTKVNDVYGKKNVKKKKRR